MCPLPAEVRIPFKSLEKVHLKTSWEKALVLSTIDSFFQSQTVSMKSGAPPSEHNKSPSGLKLKKSNKILKNILNPKPLAN